MSSTDDSQTATAAALKFRPGPSRHEACTSKTPEQMRVELSEMACAPRMSGSSIVIHHVNHLAHARGLSGEDKYTVLAYMLAKQLDSTTDVLLHNVMLSPSPGMLLDTPPVKP